MSIPLSQFDPAQGPIDRNPPFDHNDDDDDDRGSTAPTLAEHEPFISNLSKRGDDDTPKSESDADADALEAQQEKRVAHAELKRGLAKFGKGLCTFIMCVLVFTVGITVLMTIGVLVAEFVLAVWKTIGLI
ncbi:hypothetical protein F4811DRAFT_134079 [Daldinia bambusicola]|nr:hypothetical protein F4811DRAFT_134079 [Daldinia bambusicola]